MNQVVSVTGRWARFIWTLGESIYNPSKQLPFPTYRPLPQELMSIIIYLMYWIAPFASPLASNMAKSQYVDLQT